MELVGLIKSNNHYAGCIVTATLAIITIKSDFSTSHCIYTRSTGCSEIFLCPFHIS